MTRDPLGIILVNKPSGITSMQVVKRLKKCLNIKKSGHCGTLDPLATGMLPICVGQATKYSQFLLTETKQYTVTAILGIKTDTYDSDGTVQSIHQIPQNLEQLLQDNLSDYIGAFEQIPPVYSAIHYKGKRLYQLAREGIEVTPLPRPVHIYSIKVNQVTSAELSLTVVCGKGTYIRSLIHDLGEKLGCGAHVSALHRDWVAPFTHGNMTELDEVSIKHLINLNDLFRQKKSITLNQSDSQKLMMGQSVSSQNNDDDSVAIINENGEFIGIGLIKQQILYARRMLTIDKFTS